MRAVFASKIKIGGWKSGIIYVTYLQYLALTLTKSARPIANFPEVCVRLAVSWMTPDISFTLSILVPAIFYNENV